MKKHVVVLSGAGMSAESGLGTFRDAGGLWEEYNIEDVATPEAWSKDKALVTKFYNMRRKQCMESSPNKGHVDLAQQESDFDITIITQKIDDLHERAGSSNVVHLHGEIMKVKSSGPNQEVAYYAWDKANVDLGDVCKDGYQLRPHVVWFGEAVPLLDTAAEITATADIFIVVGTSLNVYPAAGLIHATPAHCKHYLIDPHAEELNVSNNFTIIRSNASSGIETVAKFLAKK